MLKNIPCGNLYYTDTLLKVTSCGKKLNHTRYSKTKNDKRINGQGLCCLVDSNAHEQVETSAVNHLKIKKYQMYDIIVCLNDLRVPERYQLCLHIKITFACVILLILNLLDEYTCNYKIKI